MQRLSTRLQQLLDFLESSPDDTFVMYALAKEYEKCNELDKSLSMFQQLLAVDPKYVGAFYHLGKLYEQLEKPELAFATYKKGMDVARSINDQHALSELAGAKLNLGDDEDFE